MSDQTQPQTKSGSGTSVLAFIVGGLLVAVCFLAWVLYGEGGLSSSDDVTISIEGAGEAIEGAVTAGE